MTNNQSVRVRFAPSPTGRFHIGGARTALYNYLLARQSDGDFILRLEDTDRKRFNPESETEFIKSLHWLGLQWDEGPDIGGPYGPYRQSERLHIYNDHIDRLINEGHAYYCFCSAERLSQVRQEQIQSKKDPRYDGLCRTLSLQDARSRINSGESYVVRFKTPRLGHTVCLDQMRGEITVENHTLDDMILLKSNGIPVYHLASMVDDYLMEISHVFRGSEWLPTFPLHTLIYRAFDWQQPLWFHLSLFLNPSGKGKLSKRQTDTSGGVQAIYTLDLHELGYIPEAVNNWLALMGWSYDDHTEFFSMQDLIDKFSTTKLNPSPAAVDYKKLDHFNKLHIRALDQEDLAERLVPVFTDSGLQVSKKDLLKIMPLIQERMRSLDESVDLSAFFFSEWKKPELEELIGSEITRESAIQVLKESIAVLLAEELTSHETIEHRLRDVAVQLELKAGQFFGVLRIAVTGQKVSPPLIESMQILGPDEVLHRLNLSLAMLENADNG
jgi:glutamyl-tRNA synthetase